MAATRFDVGGYKLAAEITGSGSPPVVFVSGLGDAGEPWQATIGQLAVATTVVTYSRAGIGESDALPGDEATRSFGAAANEVRQLLTAAKVQRPCVMVGHSIGALIAQIYARQSPDELAGLVLVDPTDAQLYLDIDEPRAVLRDGDGDRTDHMSFDMRAGAAEVAASRDPVKAPAVIISSRAGRWLESKVPHLWRPFELADLDERWQASHRALAADLGAERRIAAAGGHYVQRDQPELVAECVDQVVERARSRARAADHTVERSQME